MSIINDALKKAQAKLLRKGSKMNEQSPNAQKPTDQPGNASRKIDPTKRDAAKPGEQKKDPFPQPTEVSQPKEKTDFLKANLEHIEEQKSQKYNPPPSTPAPKPTGVPQPQQVQSHSYPPKLDSKPKVTTAATGTGAKNPFMGTLAVLVIAGILIGSIYFLADKIKANLDNQSIKNKMQQPLQALKQPIESLQSRAAKKTQPPQVNTAVKVKPIFPRSSSLSNSLAVSGIIKMGDRRAALINDEIYEVGDTIQGHKIISIELDKVVVKDGDRTAEIKVKGF